MLPKMCLKVLGFLFRAADNRSADRSIGFNGHILFISYLIQVVQNPRLFASWDASSVAWTRVIENQRRTILL